MQHSLANKTFQDFSRTFQDPAKRLYVFLVSVVGQQC